MLIRFRPVLSSSPVALPEDCAFVLCNSLVEHSLQGEAASVGYSRRVVECRLAALLLAHYLQLDQSLVKTLSDVQDLLKENQRPSELSDCMAAVDEFLKKDPYTLTEVQDITGLSLEKLKERRFWTSVGGAEEGLLLHARALHVYSETARVLRFHSAATEAGEGTSEATLASLGALMNESHASCRDLFACSCEELDSVVSVALTAGALGARLTGAGWGGWSIAMVRKGDVAAFVDAMWQRFFLPRLDGATVGSDRSKYLFQTFPASGACILPSE